MGDLLTEEDLQGLETLRCAGSYVAYDVVHRLIYVLRREREALRAADALAEAVDALGRNTHHPDPGRCALCKDLDAACTRYRAARGSC